MTLTYCFRLARARTRSSERSQHQRPPRPRSPAPAPRSQAITPPAPHTAAPLEPQAQTVAWISTLLGGALGRVLTVHRQVLYWFDVDSPGDYSPDRFPIFIWMHGDGEDDYFYGFPVLSQGIKVASKQFARASQPDRIDREVSSAEIEAMSSRHVQGRLRGVSSKCLRAETCMYTTTPDAGFALDRHPDHPQIIVASPCSGHGFKHSAGIGEALAELARDGRSRFDLSAFSLSRF